MLIGYVADEPTIRSFNNGKVANITVVTNESVRNSEGNGFNEIAEWNRVAVWGRLADVVENYVHKGTRIYIEGKLRTRSYTDKNGIKRYSTEINTDNLLLLDGRSGGNGNGFGQGSSVDGSGMDDRYSSPDQGWGNGDMGNRQSPFGYGASSGGMGNTAVSAPGFGPANAAGQGNFGGFGGTVHNGAAMGAVAGSSNFTPYNGMMQGNGVASTAAPAVGGAFPQNSPVFSDNRGAAGAGGSSSDDEDIPF